MADAENSSPIQFDLDYMKMMMVIEGCVPFYVLLSVSAFYAFTIPDFSYWGLWYFFLILGVIMIPAFISNYLSLKIVIQQNGVMIPPDLLIGLLFRKWFGRNFYSYEEIEKIDLKKNKIRFWVKTGAPFALSFYDKEVKEVFHLIRTRWEDHREGRRLGSEASDDIIVT